jgi:hypothetical protein
VEVFTMALFVKLIFLLFSFNAAADCAFKESNFTSEGSTEYLIIIVLIKDMSMKIQHEYWIPGSADMPQVNLIDGTWKCNGTNITLMYGNLEDTGKYQVVGENPVATLPTLKALFMSKSKKLLGFLILTEFDI